MNVRTKVTAFFAGVIVVWTATRHCNQQMWQISFSKTNSGHSPCAFFFSCLPLHYALSPSPVLLQHIINSVTVCSKAPCLVVHIQSCRLKQIAICMPLGERKKQREAPFLIPSLHLVEYSLFEAPNLCFSPPPTVTVRASRRQSNHSNQCFLVPGRLGSSCQNKRVSVQSL